MNSQPPVSSNQRHPTDGRVGLAGQGGAQGVAGVDLVVDEDRLSVESLLLGPLVCVLQQGVEARLQRPGWQLSLLEVLVLGVSVRHVVLLLPALPPAAVAGDEAEDEGRHSPGGDGDDEGLQAEQDHAGLDGRVVSLGQAVASLPVPGVLPVLRSLAPRVVLQLVDDGAEVPVVGGGHQVSLRTGAVTAQGNVLQEGGLTSLGPALSSLTALLSGAPGAVRILQADTLRAAPGLLTPVETDHLHLGPRADQDVAGTFLGADHPH